MWMNAEMIIGMARYLKMAILVVTLATVFPKHEVKAQFPEHPHYIWHGCYISDGNYTQGDVFGTSLQSVLSDLTAHSSASRFYNSSAGNGRGATMHGFYYCRRDYSLEICSDCVKAAVTNMSAGGYCYTLMEGVVWYQECTLAYSNRSLVGSLDDWPRGWWYSLKNVTSDPLKYGQVLGAAMNRNIAEAAASGNDSTTAGFAVGKDPMTPFETLYSLVQCRPDIDGALCRNCLQSLLAYIPTCCVDKADWLLIFNPSCQLRYGFTLFYDNQTALALLPSPSSSRSGKKNLMYYATRIGIPVAGGLVLLAAIAIGFWCCFRTKKDVVVNSSPAQQTNRDVATEEPESPAIGNTESFDFKAIESATSKFSDEKKLGQGGFGSVYMGTLNGQLVAIKRLARNTGHHMKEFKTEVDVVAKLQHRNLVRLVGFCIHQHERILVYEFVSNLSLDKFLFDASKSIYLDWEKRYKIIEGIAWGLRYLHVDSLLTIVHRDLKSSNILLDKEMNPKIADFGLAKLVTIDETSINTLTIAGTRGYMAPEYIMAGRFSVKSDIYSFGVIILEIVTGKSIGHFFDSISAGGLLHYAWRHWSQRTLEELIDPILQNNYSKIEVERCVHIGLLCVQDDMDRRPTIRMLLASLENKSLELPYPSAPPTFYHNNGYKNITLVGGQTNSPQTEVGHYRNDLYPR